MRPQGDRCWRKAGRRALRGIPAGRRTTHQVETTYGRGQRERARLAEFTSMLARQREAAATGDGTSQASPGAAPEGTGEASEQA